MQGTYAFFIFALCAATLTPTQAFLEQKLQLLKSLTGGLGGGSNILGGGGGGGYNYGSSGSYGGNSGGYTYNVPSRPLYTSSDSYGSGFGSSGSLGGEQVIKIIKVIVPAQQNSYSSGQQQVQYSSAPQPIQYAPAPQPIQYAPVPPPIQYAAPQQQEQYAAVRPAVQLAPPVQSVQISQPAPQPIQVPQPVQQISQPAFPRPVPVYRQPQTYVKTVKLVISDDDSNQYSSGSLGGVGGGYSTGYSYNAVPVGNYVSSNSPVGTSWNQAYGQGGC